jgi:hypothetical protein
MWLAATTTRPAAGSLPRARRRPWPLPWRQVLMAASLAPTLTVARVGGPGAWGRGAYRRVPPAPAGRLPLPSDARSEERSSGSRASMCWVSLKVGQVRLAPGGPARPWTEKDQVGR